MNLSVSLSRLAQPGVQTRQVPHPVSASLAATGSFIGYDLETRERVFLSDRARNKGLYLLGASGTGKSTSFINLILQDAGRGVGVCFIDPVGSAITDLVARLPEAKLQDVYLLDILNPTYTFGINLYECENTHDPDQVEAAEQRVMHLFSLLFADPATGSLGVRVEQYLSNSAHTLIKNQSYTMAEVADLFDNEALCRYLLQQVTNTQVQKFWNEYFQLSNHQRFDRREAAYTKINGFLRDEYAQQIVGQAHSTIGLQALRSLMDDPSGKILLIKLSSTRRTLSQLVGAMVIALLSEAAKTRPTEQDGTCRSRLFNIYADEFHYFATDDWEDMVEQARKHNVGVTFGHQRRSQLPDKSSVRRGSLDTANKMIFRISGASAEEVAREFDCSPRPGPPTHEQFKMPVAEPITYTVKQNKGMHPLPATRRFFEQYGKQLVEKAEEEEQAERDYKLAWDRFASTDSPHALAPTLTHPGYDSRTLIDWLNRLFYQAMKAGKEGTPLPVALIHDIICHYFIRVFARYSDAYDYLQVLDQHTRLMGTEKAPIRDHLIRKWLLDRRYAPLAAYKQRMLVIPQWEKEKAERVLRELYRRLLMMEAAALRERCVIVKRRAYYLQPEVDGNNSYSQERYMLRCVPDDKPQEERVTNVQLRDIVWGRMTLFASWQAAVSYYCNGLASTWVQVGETLQQSTSWQYQPLRVCCEEYVQDQQGTYRDERHIEVLDAWVLRPGIEGRWYTWGVLDEEISRRIEHLNSQTRDLQLLERLVVAETPLEKELEAARTCLKDTQEKLDEETRLTEEEVGKEMQQLEAELTLLSQLFDAQPGYRSYVAELTQQLFAVMSELAKAPIEADSGLTREVPTEIPSSEVERRIANDLTRLRDLTARCVFHERGRPIECTIEIPRLPQGIDDEALRTRLQLIEQQTLQAGYYKLRSTVQQEIARRQQWIQQPVTQQPPRREPQRQASPPSPISTPSGDNEATVQPPPNQPPAPQRSTQSGPPPRRGD